MKRLLMLSERLHIYCVIKRQLSNTKPIFDRTRNRH